MREFFSGFKEGFKCAGLVVNKIVTFALLFVTYFTVVGATSILGKAMRKKFMHTGHASSWIESKIGKKTDEEIRRQF
jgi:hypothetical protein